MFGSPLHSEPSIGGALIACVGGFFAVRFGVQTIRKGEITAGPKRGPYQTIRGKHAIQMGLGIVLFGLFFLVPGIWIFIEQLRQH